MSSPGLARRLKFRGGFIGRYKGRYANFGRADTHAAGRVPRTRGKHEQSIARIERLPRREGFSGRNKHPAATHPSVVLTLPRPITVKPHEWRTRGGGHCLHKSSWRWIRNLNKGALRMGYQRRAGHGKTARAESRAQRRG